jgi:hypothetical protein
MPRADVAPLGLKKQPPRFSKHFAPPGRGPQNPLAAANFQSNISNLRCASVAL